MATKPAGQPSTVGDRVRWWRESKGLSLRGLAGMAGLFASKLHRIEHGTQVPRIDDIDAIASALDVTVSDFFAPLPVAPKRKRKAS